MANPMNYGRFNTQLKPRKQKLSDTNYARANDVATKPGNAWLPKEKRSKPLRFTETGKIILDPVEIKQRLLARRKSGNADTSD